MKKPINTVTEVLLNNREEVDPTLEDVDHINILMRNTVVLSSILIRNFDELEKFKLKSTSLNQRLKNTNKALEEYLDRVFDQLERNSQQAHYVEEMATKVEKVLENY